MDDGTPSAISLISLVENLVPVLSHTKLLMLRSTVFPGITRKLQSVLKNANLNIEVAFCPERIAEGNAIKELKSLPQVIGCDTDFAYSICEKLFSNPVNLG